jgi:hypothetical protein
MTTRKPAKNNQCENPSSFTSITRQSSARPSAGQNRALR